MPRLVFDPYSGASGDMVLGALVDIGLSVRELEDHLRRILPSGWHLQVESREVNAVRGTHVRVLADDDQPARDWADIRSLIASATIPDSIKDRALAIFTLIAEAESTVHGVPVDRVHFHEVGGVDSIIDICGAAIGFELLGISSCCTLPIRLGQGFVATSHGLLPVPAPATAEILARAKLPVLATGPLDAGVEAELLTPTGAAVLGAVATPCSEHYSPVRIGYGFGSKSLPWPNALRVMVIADDSSRDEPEMLLETTIDDMNPQAYELLIERLYAAGAAEVWLTPVSMKKQRPGVVVSAIARTGARDALSSIIFEHSTSFGVRSIDIHRSKAQRSFQTVTTRFGDVTVKLKVLDGRVTSIAPEYDDCAALSRASGAPFALVWDEAHRIGERFIGTRVTAGE